MSFKEYLNIDNITEMANLTKLYHNIDNIKINIRQPGSKYQHEVSVKVFKKQNINDSLIVGINRMTNELTIYRDVGWISPKERKKVLKFIQKNTLNFINLWDNITTAPEELNWI